jgi:MinD-like ATPase involved in chromosome partitioning or flagellar assembly
MNLKERLSMKMILAIKNKNIEEKIKSVYYLKYEILVANSKDMILDFALNESELIVIVREDINGNISFEELVTNLKKYNSNIQIIVLVKKLSQKLKEMLFAKEVFNIIEGNEFLFEELTELIDNPKMVVYKQSKYMDAKNKVICVTGSRGVGKTITSIILGNLIAKNNKRVAVVDLDFVYPTMDTYLNINKNFSLADYINDLINNKLKNIENYESNDLKYKNLKYILNSKSIGIPSTEIVEKIIDNLQNQYDYIVVDTSTLMINKIYNMSKEKKYKIVLVVEPGNKAIKNYNMDTIYIEKNLLSNSIVICNKTNFINNFNKTKKEYNIPFTGNINYAFRLKFMEKINILNIKYSLKKVLKEIGIIRFEKIKLLIVQKILDFGGVKNER